MLIIANAGRDGGAKVIPKESYRSKEGCARMQDILPQHRPLPMMKGMTKAARAHGCKTLHKLAVRLCYDFLELMIDDIIENGNVYKLPIQSGALIKIAPKPEREVQKQAKRGNYKSVDVLATDFKIYEMVMDFKRRGKPQRRQIRLGYQNYQRIVEKANNGMHYTG